MPVDVKTAEAMAQLARLTLGAGSGGGPSPGEARRLAGEFSKIVGYMDILDGCPVEGVEPMYSPMLEPQPPRGDEPLGEDERAGLADAILDGSPMLSGRFFVVPKVV
jgi:aspartyl/glutamyl-tRNA(Asn/Gln) amidotransferase C subunit